MQRDKARPEKIVAQYWVHMEDELHRELARLGLWINSADLSIVDAVERSTAYGDLLLAHQARQSVGRPGTCWDKDHAAYCTSFRRSG